MGVQAPPYPHALFPRPQNVPRKDVNRWLQWRRRTLQPLSRKRSPAKAALRVARFGKRIYKCRTSCISVHTSILVFAVLGTQKQPAAGIVRGGAHVNFLVAHLNVVRHADLPLEPVERHDQIAAYGRVIASLNEIRRLGVLLLQRSAGNPRSMPSALPLQSAIWLERSLIRPLRPSIALPSSSSRLPSLRAFQSVLTPSERLGVAASISSTSCRSWSRRPVYSNRAHQLRASATAAAAQSVGMVTKFARKKS